MAVLNNIHKELAEQIVSTVKNVCGQDVNFIDPNGIIYASTNARRVGTYHDIGRMAAEQGKAIEVTKNDEYKGSRPGINVPIFHNHKVLAVIGITGAPEKVRKYAELAVRITNLLIREREINEYARTHEEKMHFILQSLIYGDSVNHEYLEDVCADLKIETDSRKSILLIHLNRRYNPKNLEMLEAHIQDFFQTIPEMITMFRYPGDYICMADSALLLKKEEQIRTFAESHAPMLTCTIGASKDLYLLQASYKTAVTALSALERTGDAFCKFDDLTLEILLSGLSDENRTTYLSKTLSELDDEDLALLKIYFDEELSLKATAERLFIHVNTLQYRLNRIADVTGFNPRKLKGAVPLYLALLLNPGKSDH